MWKYIKSNKILLILPAIFAASLIYSFYFSYSPTTDAGAYDDIARNLAQGFGYRESLEGELARDHAIIRAGPGYEFFLAGIYKIFGHRYGPVWFFQALLHALSALFVYLLVIKIFSHAKKETAALWAAAIYGFFPDLVIMSSMLLTETLALFLLLLAAVLFLKCIDEFSYVLNHKTPRDAFQEGGLRSGGERRVRTFFSRKKSVPFLERGEQRSFVIHNSYKYILILGALCGLNVLVRAQTALIVIPILAFAALSRRWLHTALFILMFAAVLTPWTMRNYKVFGELLPTAAMFGNNLAMGNHPGATGEQMDVPYAPLDDFFKDKDYVRGDKEAAKFALNFIVRNPLEFAGITLKRISIYFSFARPTGFWPQFSPLNKLITVLLSGVYSFVVFTAGIAGVFFALRRRNKGLFFAPHLRYILIIAALMPLSVVFIVVETRYRYAAYPFFAVFSGISLYFLAKERQKITGDFIPAFLLVAGSAAFDVLRNFERIISKLRGF